MSSKTAPEASHQTARSTRRPWSLAGRLAAGYGAAAFVLLLVTSGFMYWALERSLAHEDAQYASDKVAAVELILHTQPGNVAELREEIDRESASQFAGRSYIRVLDATGHLVAETDGMARALPSQAFPQAVVFHSGYGRGGNLHLADGRSYRVLSARLDEGAASHVVQFASDWTPEQRLLADYRRGLVFVLMLGLIGSAAIGYGIARRGLRPLNRMAEVIEQIGSASLHERVSGAFPAELSSLTARFNAMLQRLEDAFGRLSRFSADIAHELRTPVHNVRGLVEVTLATARTPGDNAKLLGPCLEECERISRLIDNLLFLARAENPQTQIDRQPLALDVELATLRDFYEASAADARVSLDLDAPAGLSVHLDRLLLQRAIGNLIENALAHTAEGGAIRLAGAGENGAIRITVADTGCGIPAEHLPHIFERFHRVDASRSKNTGGVGLGLAIVKSIATLHGGAVELESRSGGGTRFTLVLPVDREGRSDDTGVRTVS